ncbi:MAG: hypothetical protein H6510_13375 [Acidobacteria bacterium]|nr:hypothetical protein [Acidobacteriota bacterium]MCB9398797.1 hypothetical protein [Acidobacteriota bacterium]
MKGTLIYHAGCLDGLGSAWAARKALPKHQLQPMFHGDPLPARLGKDVWILDFSFGPETMTELAEKVRQLTLIDHHETAIRRLANWSHPHATLHLDLNQSGASLTWRTLFPQESLPKVLAYIEDRDLWRFHLPNSAAISYWLYTHLRYVKDLDPISARFEDDQEFQQIVREALVLERFVQIQVASLVASAESIQLNDHPALVVYSPLLQSEVGHVLAQRCGLGVLVSRRGESYSVSLRSDGRINVAELAETFGGGGHARAAGFTCTTLPWPRL